MKPFNQSQKIIFFICLLFLAGAVYLFSVNPHYSNPRYGQGWFALSFSDPKSNNLNFTIENFSQETNFHWEILENKKTIFQDDVQINSGEKKELSSSEIVSAKKMTVRVSSGSITQEIYKNLRSPSSL